MIDKTKQQVGAPESWIGDRVLVEPLMGVMVNGNTESDYWHGVLREVNERGLVITGDRREVPTDGRGKVTDRQRCFIPWSSIGRLIYSTPTGMNDEPIPLDDDSNGALASSDDLVMTEAAEAYLCDYEVDVRGVCIGVSLRSELALYYELEATGATGVSTSDAVCVGSFDPAKAEVISKYVREANMSVSAIELAVAREVFGARTDPRAVVDSETGTSYSGEFLLSRFPENAPPGLAEEIEMEMIR